MTFPFCFLHTIAEYAEKQIEVEIIEEEIRRESLLAERNSILEAEKDKMQQAMREVEMERAMEMEELDEMDIEIDGHV